MECTLNINILIKIGKLIFCFSVLLTGFYTNSAYAYMDPGGANLFLQLVIPVFSAIAGVFIYVRRWLVNIVKHLFYKIKNFL